MRFHCNFIVVLDNYLFSFWCDFKQFNVVGLCHYHDMEKCFSILCMTLYGHDPPKIRFVNHKSVFVIYCSRNLVVFPEYFS